MGASVLEWNWRGETVRLGVHASGTGPKLLLLPALSSISSRHELRPLQERLAPHYSTLCADWPGFGDGPRPQIDWTPEAYSAFLSFLLSSVMPQPHAVIAAGHAAAYALAQATADAPQAKLVLLAPTWRGPLPTVMGEGRPWFERLCRLVDLPVLGPLIYRLNVNRFVVRRMAAGHVYSDPASFLTEPRLREKLAVTRAPGARFASVRFVTGRLDPLASREEFLALARRAANRILLLYGAETPPRSRAEMEALAALPGVRSVRLPHGKLAVHEEFPDPTAEAIVAFLRAAPPAAAR
jgi:pimeloyl-ACP methyl ester carboxylesterase